jgi:hypothetical protein
LYQPRTIYTTYRLASGFATSSSKYVSYVEFQVTLAPNERIGVSHIEEESAQRHPKIQKGTYKRKVVASTARHDEGDDDEVWSNHHDLKIEPLDSSSQGEVVLLLKMEFEKIRANTTKVIAKAWIKAICPRKQAKFPYVGSNPRANQSQKRRRPHHDGSLEIPKFWPDVESCRHKEPDHILKTGESIQTTILYASVNS